MIVTNCDKFVLVIDGQTERDKDHNAIIWGGVYYTYNHLSYVLQRGIAKKSIQIINIDTKDIIVSVDIKKVVKG